MSMVHEVLDRLKGEGHSNWALMDFLCDGEALVEEGLGDEPLEAIEDAYTMLLCNVGDEYYRDL